MLFLVFFVEELVVVVDLITRHVYLEVARAEDQAVGDQDHGMGLQVLVHKYDCCRRNSKKHGEKSALAFYNSHPICSILFICQLFGLFEDQVVDCPLLTAVELLVLVEVENEELTMVNSAIIFQFILITALADTDDTLAVVFNKAVIVFVKMNVLMLVPCKIFIFSILK